MALLYHQEILSMNSKPNPLRNFLTVYLGIAAMILGAASWTLAQEAAKITVRGDVVQQRQWSTEELKKQFPDQIQNIKFSSSKENPQQTGTGIPLLTLIQAAAPKVEKTPKHHDLTFFVVVEARDTYRVFFSLAELLPQGGTAQAWLIWDVDGKTLLEKEAPYRLVVLSDRGRDRQIYAITTIRLIDGAKLATQSAAGQ
jgi:hypothetical protein